MRGHIIDIFTGQVRDRSAIFAVGRLENGENFAVVDDRLVPTLYIRRSDRAKAEPILQRLNAKRVEIPWTSMDGEAVDAVQTLTFPQLRRLDDALRAQDIRSYEADIDPAIRYRQEKQIGARVEIEGDFRASEHVNRLYFNPTIQSSEQAIDLRMLALDIETDAKATEIYGLSLVTWNLSGTESQEEVLLREGQNGEKDLLLRFQQRLKEIDPDIISGWNILDFDLMVLSQLFQKHRIPINWGRSKENSYLRATKGFFTKHKAVIHGRQVLDAMQLVRVGLSNFEDLRLDTVAKTLLGRGKTLVMEEWDDAPTKIADAFFNDKEAFTAYVLEDSRLVRDILRSQNLIELTVARSQLTRMPLDRAWTSVVAFENLYIGELHKKQIVAPSWGVDSGEVVGNTGGLVFNPKVGLHGQVLVFDFKSLYPSIMRTFNIDPLAFVKGQRDSSGAIRAPNGAYFDREPAILPGILENFFANRERAKANKDALASYTYKILMNSFYGVLGTDSCRFANSAIADAITGFGQTLLRWMRDRFETWGYPVLYGDTDSLFVQNPGLSKLSLEERLEEGKKLCAAANQSLALHLKETYQVESHMELEFEKYYRFLFLPADRQGDGGRAKNYAGLLQSPGKEKIDITGMEAVRSDWTPLAKILQRELLAMLFQQAKPETMQNHVQDLVQKLWNHEIDDRLIYRKRIRKSLESYTKTTPPHIKAARLLPKTVRVVRYHMTEDGPQPLGFQTSSIDYEHYLEKQMRPIVEGLAPFAGFSAEEALRAADVGELKLLRQ